MSLSVEKLEGSMAKLTIEVPAEEFEKAMTKAYQKQKNRIAIQGFRKGKVPQAIVEKMYGPEVFYDDAANLLINEYYPKELENCEEEVVSNPEIDVEQIGKGQNFIFNAVVALKPELKLGEYKGVEIEKIPAEVTEDEVMAEILKAQKENSRKVPVEDRAAQLEDEVTINFDGYMDGVAFEGGKGDNYKLTLGSHSFIDTFEDQIVGKNIGDSFDVNVTFPEEYHAADLAGKPAVFKVDLLGISAIELPELDDDFASEVSSFDTFDEYKEDVKKVLEVKKEKTVKSEKQAKILEKLCETAEVEIPEAMIEYNQERMFDEFAQSMMYQGLQMEQYLKLTNTSKEELMERIKPDAIARIKTGLVLEEVVKAEGITATDEEFEEQLKSMAAAYQMDVEKIKEIMGDKEADSVKKDVCQRKALDFLVENCKEV
ncbi:MAG: trigger factor [Lachnospiraceae bacterium]|nr:trigger factor [Lachnospiraceae bacterium]MBQ8317287.1 trigger factor [Lachnospiraceae bacterium]